MKLWNVYRTAQAGRQTFERYLCSVEAESASDATDIAHKGTMTSRLDLVAYPDEIDGHKAEWPEWAPRVISLSARQPGRPRQYGKRERATLMLSMELIAVLDERRGDESQSVYVEQALRELWGMAPLKQQYSPPPRGARRKNMANPFSYDAEREVYTASLADGRTLQIDRVEFEAAEAFFARGDLNNPAESGDFEQVYNPETWRGAEGNGHVKIVQK